jgi:L-lactate dehydrogenase complex protein LldG
MNSRDSILNKIRKNQPAFPSISEPSIKAITFQDVYLQFFAVLTTIGGVAVDVNSRSEISEHVTLNFSSAKRIVNLVDGLSIPKDESLQSDPHLLENVDVAIISGSIAVAENSAVWIEDKDMADRALPFITQHLVLVIERKDIVNNMQEAYERLGAAHYNFGTFIAGPSKTADIEQSLVLGAHGAKTLTVFVVS